MILLSVVAFSFYWAVKQKTQPWFLFIENNKKGSLQLDIYPDILQRDHCQTFQFHLQKVWCGFGGKLLRRNNCLSIDLISVLCEDLYVYSIYACVICTDGLLGNMQLLANFFCTGLSWTQNSDIFQNQPFVRIQLLKNVFTKREKEKINFHLTCLCFPYPKLEGKW